MGVSYSQEDQISEYIVKDHKTKTYLRRAIKAVLWMLAGIAGLIILAVAALQFHGVQQYVVQKIISSISNKTHTRIEVGAVDIAFTHSVVLQDIFVEGRQRDTLLSIRTLAVDVNLLSLLSHDINVTNIRIDSLTAHITRTLPDSSFNFDFILNALSPNSTAADKNLDTSSGPQWEIRLGALSLNSAYATYDDAVSGLGLRFQIGTLKAAVDGFDLNNLKFHVDDLFLSNSAASVTLTKESHPDTTRSKAVDVGVRSLSLANIHFIYENISAGEQCGVELGSSTLLAEKVDLPSHRIAVKNFMLENTNIALVLPPPKNHHKSKPADADVLPWVISLDRLRFDNNSFRYDGLGAAKTKGVDPNHPRLTRLTMRAEKLYYSENRIAANVDHMSFREDSGLELRELSGRFVLDSLHAQVTDFIVETPASRISQNILLTYASISDFKNHPGTVIIKSSIADSHLAVSDLLFFAPSLPIRNSPGASIQFSSQLSGRIGDLRVEELRIAAGDSTTIDVTGSIQGLPDIATAYFDMNLHLLSSGREDIRALVVDSLLPKGIVLPASIRISGNFKGTAKNFSASSAVATSIGNLKGTAELHSGAEPDSNDYRWKADVITEEFNVGRLINDSESLGPVSLRASAAGTGLRKDDIKAQLDVDVSKAVVNGYPYRQLSLHGIASPTMFAGRAEIQDSNIVFTFNGTINTNEENPEFKFKLELKGADLRRLNLTSEDIQVSGTMTSDLTGQNLNDLIGIIGARDVVIVKNNKRYVIDSLVVASVKRENQTHISIESTILAGRIDGTIAPGDLPEMLKNHFSHYFTLQGVQRMKSLKPEVFTFHITLRDPATLTEIFFPELHRLSAGSVEGNYDSDTKNLNVNIDIPTIDYEEFKADSLAVRVTSNADLLQATLSVGSISDSTLEATNLHAVGKAGHDSIEVALQSTGRDGSMKMRLAGVFSSVPDGYKFRFDKEGICFTMFHGTFLPTITCSSARTGLLPMMLRCGARDNPSLSTALTRRTRARR